MEAMEIMGMGQQGLEELAAQLAKELLARKGYDVIDGDWMLGRRGLVARDGDCLVFADVAPIWASTAALSLWTSTAARRRGPHSPTCLAATGGDDAEIRFDAVRVKPLPSGKAFAKHVVNALGAGA